LHPKEEKILSYGILLDWVRWLDEKKRRKGREEAVEGFLDSCGMPRDYSRFVR
jgi:hypothetical protein